jgi:large subunit ribosomal protein L24
MIHKGDRVVLLKDITYTEMATEEPEQKVARSKKGDVSRVLRVLLKKGKVIVEGVNYRKKAIRPSQDNPRGGWLQKELPIDVSNVMLFCPECGKGVKPRKVIENGKKKRVCNRAGHELPYVK